MLRTIDRSIEMTTVAIIVVLMSVMTVSIVAGVFYRYVLNAPLSWTEEIARYAMVWVSVLGGGLAFRRGGHVAVTFVVDAFPNALRTITLFLGGVAILTFLFIMFWYGWQMAEQVRFQRSAALRFSMSYAYAAIPVGAALMIYHMLVATYLQVFMNESPSSRQTGI
ncbi:TRAP transporter small permease [Fodinicurvata sp. EGI_FJ10296]|uniref:TRAP transporter small permease n=1 Tax=Fodinicurvata sp. EGI_FJ10296 TaxID=3231908 RepID=UPI0034520F16